MEFLKELSVRNYSLYLFGWICLTGALFSFYMIATTTTQVNGINAWIKPAKFFISTFLFVWTMGWFLGYLSSYNLNWYNWVVILVLAFELIYISIRAGQGQLSHFNVSSAFNGLMFSLMGLAISIMTLATLYIGYLFFKEPLPHLPITYVWGIRLGIIIFVLFAFEGGLMGSRLSHTVGAADGTPGLQLLNWSVTNGDLRIAHFIGMHALQVLPILGYYAFGSLRGIVIASSLYLIISIGVLVQALFGMPIIKRSNTIEVSKFEVNKSSN